MLAEISGAAQINSCNVIPSPGTYVLSQDILDSAEIYCINITSSDVILDGAGHSIDGKDTIGTYGIYVHDPGNILSNITLKNLVLKDWTNGIYFDNIRDGRLYNNNVSSNNRGVYFTASSNNTIYNNYFSNTNNALDNGDNIWNISKRIGQNIVLGVTLGGNYWSDYSGIDTDGDGLGNTSLPYNSSGAIVSGGDYLPLIIPSPVITPTPTPTSPPTPVLNDITVTPLTVSLAEGDAQTFTAILKDQFGNLIDATITWSSGNPTAGTITPGTHPGTGVYTAVFNAITAGTTTITATDGTVSGTASVTVKAKPVCSAVDVLPYTATFIIEDPKKFYAVPKDQYGDPMKETIIWNSSNSNVGSIDPVTGVFTALRPGITTIRATCGNVSGTGTAIVKTTQFYQFSVIGKTGQAGITSIGDGPSINDMGNVAFSASVGNFNIVFIGNGSLSANPKQITPMSSRRFNDKVIINNQNHVMTSFIVAGNPPASYIAKLDPILYDSYVSGSADYYATNLARGGGIMGSYYDAVGGTGGSMNDNDQVAYTAYKGGELFVTGNSPEYGGTRKEMPVMLSARSMMANNGNIVLRARGTSPTEPVVLYNYDLSRITDIANTGMGFTAIGSNPGISSNGRIVAFYGDLGLAGAAALNTTPGPGIFASIDEGTGGNRRIVRVAGQQIENNSASGGNDDGICNTGETCILADLGFDASGNPVFFSSFDTTARIGVIHQNLGVTGLNEDSFLVSFIATPNAAIPISSTDQKGIWTSRVDVGQKSGGFVYNTSVPMKVAQVGDVMDGRTITDIKVHDQIANIGNSPSQNKGDNRVAFWASTNLGSMVVRATKVSCGSSTTARRITTLGASGPQYATPNKDIILNINYIGTSNCAKYFFRAFGKYGTGPWQLLGSESLEAGSYTFPMSIKIPRPSGNENTLTIRVVGQSQRWPNVSNFDMMKEITVNMLYIKEIKIEGTPGPNNLTTEGDVKYTAVLSRNLGAKVNWISAPTGTRTKQTSTAGRPSIPNRVKNDENPWTDRSPRDTHGKKNVTAKVTWIIGGQTYTDEKQKDFNLSFRKAEQDFNTGCDSQGTRCDNWFRYWSTSDDSSSRIYDRTKTVTPTYRYMGGGYDQSLFAQYVPDPDHNTYYIEMSNRNSMGCAFNFQLPVVGVAVINFNNKLNGSDCVEDTLTHEISHRNVDANWAPGGAWHNLFGPRTIGPGGNDIDDDEIPNEYENGSLLLNGWNLSILGFDPNNPDSFPAPAVAGGFGFPYGDDEEVLGEMRGFGVTSIHENDWAKPGKQSTPAFKRIILENGTGAQLTGNFTENGRDVNGNGLFDFLTVELEVNVSSPGTYSVFGNLYNNGNDFVSANNLTFLDKGIQTIDLNFDGKELRKGRMNGPYELRKLFLFTSITEDDGIKDGNVYTTSSYNFTQFEKPDIEFSGSFSESVLDTNINGLYDNLVLGIGVDVVTNGDYTISANLENNGTTISIAKNLSYLTSGTHIIDLNFDGLEIRANRKNGQYKIGLLRAYDVSGNDIDVLYDPYDTSIYAYTQFERPKAEFTQNFTDIGVDTDGDGFYNYLTLSPEIDVGTPGTYSIRANLLDSNYTGITWNSTTAYLSSGMQTISLPFDGMVISDHGINGSYKISALTLDDETGNMVSYAIYNLDTSSYNYTKFQRSSRVTGIILDSSGIPLPGIDVYLIGHDTGSTQTGSNGSYSFTGLKQGNYTVEANPSNPNLMVNSTDVYLSGGSTIKIDFTLQPAGSISGRVIDVNGNPIPDALLYLSGFELPRYSTDANGSYSIPGLGEGTYEVNVDATDLNFFENSSVVSVMLGQTTVVDFTLQKAPDDTPPGSVTDLKSISNSQNHINWTWIDPQDRDFAYVEVWIDGVLKASVLKGVQNYTATGFAPGTEHTIAIRTVDNSGNINPEWVTDTSRTTLLLIFYKDPESGSTFPKDTTSIMLSLQTDKISECRLSETTREFADMSVFGVTNNFIHITQANNLKSGVNYTIFINCKDQSGTQNNTESFTFYIHNRTFMPPLLEQIPDINAFENQTVTIPVNATDPENDPLTITVQDRSIFGYIPIASRIIVENQVMKLRTNYEDAGRYYLRVAVSDGKDTVTRDFNLNINNVNRPPTLEPAGSKIAIEGTFFSTDTRASDPDGNDLRFSDNTSLFNINPFNGKISFTPKNYQVGDHYVNISVTDGEFTAYEDVLFHITNVNNPPVISPILPQKAIPNELFTLQINASDPDNDPLAFSDDTDLFNISTQGLISFTPSRIEEGKYLINITVTDGLATNTKILNLVVSGISRTPIITNITDRIIVYRNQSFEINVTACDPGVDAGCN